MTLAECSFGAFTILNIVRLVAYVPQLMRVHRDINGAELSLAGYVVVVRCCKPGHRKLRANSSSRCAVGNHLFT